MNKKLIFVFLDGIGLAKTGPDNLCCQAKMPFLKKILNGPLAIESTQKSSHVLLKGIDANLGVEGIPQSATGQTALFTGINAAKILGYHQPAFPDSELKKIIENSNIFIDLLQKHKTVTFANCYSPQYFELVNSGKRIHSATTLMLISAGLPFRNLDDLEHNNALYWDITREYLTTNYQNQPVKPVTPEEAGKHLANLAKDYHFTLFESFLTDLLGHKRNNENKNKILFLIDRFIENIYLHKSSGTSLLITSDHGNIEEANNGQHNRNPVPLLIFGEAADFFSNLESILEIKEMCLKYLS